MYISHDQKFDGLDVIDNALKTASEEEREQLEGLKDFLLYPDTDDLKWIRAQLKELDGPAPVKRKLRSILANKNGGYEIVGTDEAYLG